MSELLIPLTTTGVPFNLIEPIVAKCSRTGIKDVSERKDYVFVLANDSGQHHDLQGYGAVLTDVSLTASKARTDMASLPGVHSLKVANHVSDGDIVVMYPSGFVRTLYRVNSKNNVIFSTDRCNSNCVMCSQPPKKIDDSYLVEQNLKMISLIDPKPEFIGISGGEPTLLKDDLFRIMSALKVHLPNTFVNMLTNGRMFFYSDFADKYAAVEHPRFRAAIPLYSDIPDEHDFVVQSKGAFVQTMRGLYNLGELGQPIEIRVVLHKLTYRRLPQLAEFIYKNLPFAAHIAFMGMEIMGYVKKNLDLLWIDPVDYQEELYQAVAYLNAHEMNVSIYNHQLCVLKKVLWPFSRKSISDFKNIYLDECANCNVLEKCGGLFKSAHTIHSKYIKAISS